MTALAVIVALGEEPLGGWSVIVTFVAGIVPEGKPEPVTLMVMPA